MKSIKRKFNIFGILLVFTMMVGLLIQYLYLNNEIIGDRKLILRQSNEHLSHQVTSNIKYHSQYAVSAAEFIAMNGWSEEKILEYFQGLADNNPTIKYIYFGRPDNKLIITGNYSPPGSYDLRQRDWYKGALEKNGVFVSDIYSDIIDNNLVVAISKPVYNKQGKFLGVVALDIGIEKIIEIVQDSTIKGTGYSFLIDGKGNIIAHSNYEYKPGTELKKLDTLAQGIHNKIKEEKIGQIETEFDKVRGYLSFEPVENTDWTIGNFLSLTEFRDHNWDLWRIFLITLGLALIVFYTFTYLQRVNFINPVDKLDKDIRVIGISENIGYRLPIVDKDPFKHLRTTINEILNRTQEYFEQTEQDSEEIMAQNEELEASYGQLAAIEQELRQQYDKLLESEKELVYLSYHDQLTGLYNRRFFEEELSRLDVPRNLPISLVMADVNGLKLINDSFGHKAGDDLLKNISKIIKEGCREDDIIARLSGDEFVIVLPRTDEIQAEAIVERLKSIQLKDEFLKEKNMNMELSISFGVGTKYAKDINMQDVLKLAEDRMYTHKLFVGPSMRSRTIETIIKALYEKNRREEQHSTRVSILCQDIGVKLGMNEDRIKELESVGLLHDIGKIAINETILDKPGKLTEDEWEQIKKHPEIGYRILSTVNEMSQIAEYVLYHHERYDGKGYPKGLKGEEIPLVSRIISVADAYDAMASDRPYRNALSEEEIVKELIKNSGTQFDPKIVRILVEEVLGFEWKEEKND